MLNTKLQEGERCKWQVAAWLCGALQEGHHNIRLHFTTVWLDGCIHPMLGQGSIFCTGQVLKEDGRLSLSLSRLFGLYGKGMTIERRGVREVRGAASWQRSILRWGDAAASRSDAICVWIFMNHRKAITSVLNILSGTSFVNCGGSCLNNYS